MRWREEALARQARKLLGDRRRAPAERARERVDLIDHVLEVAERRRLDDAELKETAAREFQQLIREQGNDRARRSRRTDHRGDELPPGKPPRELPPGDD